MTESKISNAEAKDQLSDEQLDTATGGSGLFGWSLEGAIAQTIGDVLGGKTILQPLGTPTGPNGPAGSRPGVPTTQRSN